MFNLSEIENVYLAVGPTDLRKPIDGLSLIVQSTFKLDLFEKSIFVFCNKAGDKIKIIHFDNVKPSFYVYPDASIGDVSVQGEILKWLYTSLKKNPEFTPKDYEKLLYNKFKPGGNYLGYVESYGKEQVFNRLIKDLRQDIKPIKPMDHQLVGFVPSLATR